MGELISSLYNAFKPHGNVVILSDNEIDIPARIIMTTLLRAESLKALFRADGAYKPTEIFDIADALCEGDMNEPLAKSKERHCDNDCFP